MPIAIGAGIPLPDGFSQDEVLLFLAAEVSKGLEGVQQQSRRLAELIDKRQSEEEAGQAPSTTPASKRQSRRGQAPAGTGREGQALAAVGGGGQAPAPQGEAGQARPPRKGDKGGKGEKGGKAGKAGRGGQAPARPPGFARRDEPCFLCGELGHWSRECPYQHGRGGGRGRGAPY